MAAAFDPFAAAPQLMKNWMTTSMAIAENLDPGLAELVKIRASQINGCANCLNMHTAAARTRGESEQRLYLLSAWREAPCYSAREKAALGWTDALTLLSDAPPAPVARDALKAHFSEAEQVALTLLIGVINSWNQLSVGFGLWIDPAAAKAAQQAAA